MPKSTDEFPKYLLKVDGVPKFLSLREAYTIYNNGFVQVSFGEYVLNEDLSVRELTQKDRNKISDAADEYGASK